MSGVWLLRVAQSAPQLLGCVSLMAACFVCVCVCGVCVCVCVCVCIERGQ